MQEITQLSQLDLNKSYTYADYLLWKFSERVELIKGKVFEMSPAPSRKHQEVSHKINRYFDRYFEKNNCSLYYAPFDVRLYKKNRNDELVETVVQPDLCVVCDLFKLDDKGCIGSPDLIVEILSPNSTKHDLNTKFNLYEENEVKEYWIVHPFDETISIYTLQNGKYIGLKPKVVGEVIESVIFPKLNFEVGLVFE